MSEESLVAYKGFDKDWKCRGFQYEIGGTYEHNSATGYQSVSSATGDRSASSATGGAIVLCNHNDDGSLRHIRASKVGENGIKPDTFYVLNTDGEFEEAAA